MQDLTRVKHVCMAVRSAAEKEQALKHGIDDACHSRAFEGSSVNATMTLGHDFSRNGM